jgi:hypothetical protein
VEIFKAFKTLVLGKLWKAVSYVVRAVDGLRDSSTECAQSPSIFT